MLAKTDEDRSCLVPCYAPVDVSFERGQGSYLYTKDGKPFLDFCSGIAVCSLGHSHPAIVNAICEQSQQIMHCSNLYKVPQATELARLYVQKSFADRVFFCNSGTEAIETGIKMIRAYQRGTGNIDRYRLITFRNAFHGRTIAASSACNKMGAEMGPALEGFDIVDIDLDSVKKAISKNTAAILIEPIQGEGGINVVPNSFLESLRELCNENGLLLFLDCVQCGSGRTGKLFAYEHTEIAPDLCAIAKGMGGGFPIGACLAKEQVAAHLKVGMHGSTYGGNPLATHVATTVLKEITRDGFLDTVMAKGNYMKAKLESFDMPGVDSIVGKGLMLGVRVEKAFSNKLGGLPQIVQGLAKRHLLCIKSSAETIRLLPPLTIDFVDIDKGCDIIADFFRDNA